MKIILTGNKSGKGNGKRIVVDNPISIIQAVIELQDFQKIRITPADEWICDDCLRHNVTKSGQVQCGYCKKIGRKIVQGNPQYRDIEANIQSLVEKLFVSQDRCLKCGLKVNECRC